jgi:hypothetical protein
MPSQPAPGRRSLSVTTPNRDDAGVTEGVIEPKHRCKCRIFSRMPQSKTALPQTPLEQQFAAIPPPRGGGPTSPPKTTRDIPTAMRLFTSNTLAPNNATPLAGISLPEE